MIILRHKALRGLAVLIGTITLSAALTQAAFAQEKRRATLSFAPYCNAPPGAPRELSALMMSQKPDVLIWERKKTHEIKDFVSDCLKGNITGSSEAQNCQKRYNKIIAEVGAHNAKLKEFCRSFVDASINRENLRKALLTAGAAFRRQMKILLGDVAQALRAMPVVNKVVPARNWTNGPPGKRRTVHEGVVLGLTQGKAEARAFGQVNSSPFMERSYRDAIKSGQALVIGFGQQSSDRAEIIRGNADNQCYGCYSLSSPQAQEIIRSLKGTHFKRLIAHSNGATTSEALIRSGVISVEELNIVGGDRSLANLPGYQELIRSGKVKRVRVWLNPGDPIPGVSSTHHSYPIRNLALYATSLLVPTGSKGGDATVEVYVLKNPKAPGMKPGLQAHDLAKSYFPSMRANGYVRVRHLFGGGTK